MQRLTLPVAQWLELAAGSLGSMRRSSPSQAALRAQGLYYVATGLWPIVHLRSFMTVTGPKREGWLVQTFGALVAGIGLTLLSPATDEERPLAARLGVACALILAGSEAWFVARRRIRPIYLADAALELALAAAVLRRGSAARAG